ncbi:hypothetical protein QLX08_011646 [Tetragonisca angustula]|uniref:Uncharacterized protein n=1 Tax=Tetragonisca angustula TaxID=166442 RepID=A0AAW0Z7F3_9HYME
MGDRKIGDSNARSFLLAKLKSTLVGDETKTKGASLTTSPRSFVSASHRHLNHRVRRLQSAIVHDCGRKLDTMAPTTRGIGYRHLQNERDYGEIRDHAQISNYSRTFASLM